MEEVKEGQGKKEQGEELRYMWEGRIGGREAREWRRKKK